MHLPFLRTAITTLAAILAFSAVEATAGPVQTAQIEARQLKFRDMGGALKAIMDELKKTSVNWGDAVQPAAQTLKDRTGYVANWFPRGTGPESGAKTYALPAIWQKSADFARLARSAQEEAAKLQIAAAGKDVAGLRTQAIAVGKACKACHDSYRSSDFGQ